jgi:hypothetical protein
MTSHLMPGKVSGWRQPAPGRAEGWRQPVSENDTATLMVVFRFSASMASGRLLMGMDALVQAKIDQGQAPLDHPRDDQRREQVIDGRVQPVLSRAVPSPR